MNLKIMNFDTFPPPNHVESRFFFSSYALVTLNASNKYFIAEFQNTIWYNSLHLAKDCNRCYI